jgi:hypothetical protein
MRPGLAGFLRQEVTVVDEQTPKKWAEAIHFRTISTRADVSAGGFRGRLEVFTETNVDTYLDTLYVTRISLSRRAALQEARSLRDRLGIIPLS